MIFQGLEERRLVFSKLLGGQSVYLVGVDQPILIFIKEVIGRQIDFAPTGFVVRRGNSDVSRNILSQQFVQSINHCVDCASCVKDIIDNEQLVFMGQSLDEITQTVDLDLPFLLVDTLLVRGRSYRDVVGLYARISKYFLHSDANRRTTAPNTDDKGWFEAAIDDLGTQLKRIVQ